MTFQEDNHEETLKEAYPKEWEDLTKGKVPKKEIDEYLLRFVARLLREVKAGKRKDIDLGDGSSIGSLAMTKEGRYKLRSELDVFLMKLDGYKIEFPNKSTIWGSPETPKEIETELRKVAKKLKIKLDL